MVDVQLNNIKLQKRAENIIMTATGVDRDTAKQTLEKADGSVKLAITMILLNCSREEAEEKLAEANGHIRRIIT